MQTLRIAVLSVFLAVPLAAGQPPAPAPVPPSTQPAAAPPPATVPDQLARLNQTLEHIAQLLERQNDGQKLDLLLRRVEVGSRRVSSLEQQLDKAQSDKRSMEDTSYRMRSQLAAMKTRVEGLSPDEQAANQSTFEAGMKNMEDEAKLADLRVQQATQRVLDLQGELDGQKQDLQALQNLLDRKLQGQ